MTSRGRAEHRGAQVASPRCLRMRRRGRSCGAGGWRSRARRPSLATDGPHGLRRPRRPLAEREPARRHRRRAGEQRRLLQRQRARLRRQHAPGLRPIPGRGRNQRVSAAAGGVPAPRGRRRPRQDLGRLHQRPERGRLQRQPDLHGRAAAPRPGAGRHALGGLHRPRGQLQLPALDPHRQRGRPLPPDPARRAAPQGARLRDDGRRPFQSPHGDRKPAAPRDLRPGPHRGPQRGAKHRQHDLQGRQRHVCGRHARSRRGPGRARERPAGRAGRRSLPADLRRQRHAGGVLPPDGDHDPPRRRPDARPGHARAGRRQQQPGAGGRRRCRPARGPAATRWP